MDQTVNWFVNSRCNLTCQYCFREMDLEEKDTDHMLSLVQKLAEKGVTRVTIGGGEPLLRKDLEIILAALKNENIFVSLHTNGTLLRDRIEGLHGLVDILSLPLDSVHEPHNLRMRGMPYVNLIDEIIGYTAGKFSLAFKTTTTQVNAEKITDIYEKINQTPFEYWKVYQFRPLNVAAQYAQYFTLSDEQFEKLREKLNILQDSRIEVINGKQGHQPYLFLTNNGSLLTVDPVKEENIHVAGIDYDFSAVTQLIKMIYHSDHPYSPRQIKWKWSGGEPDVWILRGGPFVSSNSYHALDPYSDD